MLNYVNSMAWGEVFNPPTCTCDGCQVPTYASAAPVAGQVRWQVISIGVMFVVGVPLNSIDVL